MKDLTRFPTTKIKAKSFKANLKHAARQHAKQDLRVLTQEALQELDEYYFWHPQQACERIDYAL